MRADSGPAPKAKRVKKRPKAYSLPASTRSDAASGGRNQMKVAARYKTTRRYARDYNAGFEKNPHVAPAIRTMKREKAAGRYNSKAINKAFRTYEKETRRGPDEVVNKPAYRAYTKGLWEKVKDDYPGSDKRPKAAFGDVDKGSTAYVQDAHNKVHYGRGAIRKYMGYDGPGRDYAKTLPLHEWAHTRQYARLPTWAAEGAAELKKDREAKKLGLRRTDMGKEYAAYERKARGVRRRAGAKRFNRKIYR